MTTVENLTLDEERALYGSTDINVKGCRFDGVADGESALKESRGVTVTDTFFNLRYPLWHVKGASIYKSEMTEMCRAPIWYSSNITLENCTVNGTKALRECNGIKIKDCTVSSDECGWSISDVLVDNSSFSGEYFMLRASNLRFATSTLNGKYSFQYLENAVFENCTLNTKDAFWHAKNVTLRNCTVKGEYFGWYSENLTLENCIIEGTQPLCYCKGFKMLDCKMHGADLSFEKSEVDVVLTEPIVSIKNPKSGKIRVPSYGELIMDNAGDVEIITE